MKDRVKPCIHYMCEGKCELNKEANFWKHCQKCDKYVPNKKANDARLDNRRKKLDNIISKETKYIG